MLISTLQSHFQRPEDRQVDRAAGGLQPARRRARPHAQDEEARRPREEQPGHRGFLQVIERMPTASLHNKHTSHEHNFAVNFNIYMGPILYFP